MQHSVLVGWRIKLNEPVDGVEGGLIVGTVTRTGKSTQHTLMRDGHCGYLVIELRRKPSRISSANPGAHFTLVERAQEGPTRTGKLVKRAMRSGRNWRTRSFVLNSWSGQLEWFKPVRGVLSKKAKPLGAFEISRPDSGIRVRVLADEATPEPDGKKYCFEIYSERFEKMRLMLSATSSQEMRNWCSTITATIAHHEQMDLQFGKVERKTEMSDQDKAQRRQTRAEGLKFAALARKRRLAEQGKAPDVAALEATMMATMEPAPWDGEEKELIVAVRRGLSALAGALAAGKAAKAEDNAPGQRAVKESVSAVWSAVEHLDDPPEMCLRHEFADLVRHTMHAPSLAERKRLVDVGPVYGQLTATLEAAYDWLDQMDQQQADKFSDSDDSDGGGGGGADAAEPHGEHYWQLLEQHDKLFLDDHFRDQDGLVTGAGAAARVVEEDGEEEEQEEEEEEEEEEDEEEEEEQEQRASRGKSGQPLSLALQHLYAGDGVRALRRDALGL